MARRKFLFGRSKHPKLKQTSHARREMKRVGVQPYIEGMDVEEARKTLKGMRKAGEAKKVRKRRKPKRIY